MWALLARAIGSQAAKAAIGRYGKSAWTVAKRIGWRNARRWALLDDAAPGAAAGRIGETADTTQWIMQRIMVSDLTKRAKTELLKRTGLNRTIYNTNAARTVRHVRTTAHTKKVQRIQSVRATQSVRSQYNINTRTGEIGGGTFRDQLGDAGRFIQSSWLSPESKYEQILHGFAKGFIQQEAATFLFTKLTENEDLAPIAWASQFTHNLDEIYLPPGTAKSTFAFSELFIQAFNVATVKNTTFGLQRVNRLGMARDLAFAARQRSIKVLSGYATPTGVSRMAGALTARQFNIMTGEDDRQREAYVKRAIARQGKSNKKITIEIRSYTRSDGTYVKAHTRQVEAYY